MDATVKAIETTGTIDAQHRLLLDEPLPVACPTKVRVIILLPEEADINEKEWLYAAASNPAFDFQPYWPASPRHSGIYRQ
ncbi:MAG: hypothetical protein OIN66_09815 [Candidatus Methanoperedens sp.]|nr:hypothetical protein [Candidatus Methanoperedens sp.]